MNLNSYQNNTYIELARIVDELNIPVMAFGLKNDFQNELLEGSNTTFYCG